MPLIVAAVFFGAVASILFCLIPPFIAYKRHHRNRVAILALSLLLGWTLLGWVAALVWSLTDQPATPTPTPSYSPQPDLAQNPSPEKNPVASSSRLVLAGFIVLVGLVLIAAGFFEASGLSRGAMIVSSDAVIDGLTQGGDPLIGNRKFQDKLLSAVFQTCTLKQMLPVDLDGNHSMNLEELSCPYGYYPNQNALGDPKSPREVLVLYERHWWGRRIEAALWSDAGLPFDSMTAVKTDEGNDAVLWTGGSDCGRCEGDMSGEGILGWVPSKSKIDWNLSTNSIIEATENLLGKNKSTERGYLIANSLGINYGAEIIRSTDAACCPSGGSLTARVHIVKGFLRIVPGSLLGSDSASATP